MAKNTIQQVLFIIIIIIVVVVLLSFDLLTRPKMPFKVMHQKEVTHSNGS